MSMHIMSPRQQRFACVRHVSRRRRRVVQPLRRRCTRFANRSLFMSTSASLDVTLMSAGRTACEPTYARANVRPTLDGPQTRGERWRPLTFRWATVRARAHRWNLTYVPNTQVRRVRVPQCMCRNYPTWRPWRILSHGSYVSQYKHTNFHLTRTLATTCFADLQCYGTARCPSG